jgi:integrase
LIFQKLQVNIRRSIYHHKLWVCKSEHSRRPLPLDSFIADDLRSWKEVCPYNAPEDLGFR